MVDYLAVQLEVPDAACVKRYAERPATQWEHAAEIRQAYGYRDFADPGAQEQLRAFVDARAWTRAEGPRALFDQAVAWLRAQRVLLPGASVLARLVAELRTAAADRLYALMAFAAAGADAGLPARLDGLLSVPGDARVSELERLRRAPARASAPQMVRALDRAAEIRALGAGQVELLGVPANRLEALARYGLATKAPTLRGLAAPRRTATLLATARALEISAVDDVLDLFAVLMATKLLAWAERESNRQRLRDMPRLARASVTLAAAARVLLEADGQAADAGQLWQSIELVASRERVAAAVAAVEELGAPFGGEDDDEADRRAEMVRRYATVRPFLPMLTQVVPFGAHRCGRPGSGRRRGAAGPGGPQARLARRGRRIAGDRVVAAAGVCQPGTARRDGGSPRVHAVRAGAVAPGAAPPGRVRGRVGAVGRPAGAAAIRPGVGDGSSAGPAGTAAGRPGRRAPGRARPHAGQRLAVPGRTACHRRAGQRQTAGPPRTRR